MRILSTVLSLLVGIFSVAGQEIDLIKYADFENWVTRNITESKLLGGNTKKVYKIAPEMVIDGNKVYSNMGGSPWATSNVMANVMGIVKASNAVFPDANPAGGRCCKLTTVIEKVKVLGIVNLQVLVSGSIYLGYNIEPIKMRQIPIPKWRWAFLLPAVPRLCALTIRCISLKG